MVRPLDLKGQKFGLLTVIERSAENTSSGGANWVCQCDCGSEPKVISGLRLRTKKGPTRSCGCLNKEINYARKDDLRGQTFDALTALEYIPGKGKGKRSDGRILAHWRCRCICGEIVEVKPQVLKNFDKRTRYRLSCGAPRCAADSECIGPILPIDVSRARGLKTYFPGIRCSAGHFAEHVTSNQSCLSCHLKRGAEFQKANPEKTKEYDKRSREKPERKAKRNAQLTKRRKEDPVFYTAEVCKNRVKSVFRREQIPKTGITRKLLGIDDWEKLKEHIESQFGGEYSWENRDQWHIDHIRPIASFDVMDKKQQLVAFNWRNLQPLWGIDNLDKNDEYEPHHEVEWARRMRKLGYDGELFLLFEEGRGGLYGSPTD